MKTFKIFILEDDVWYSEILEYHLSLNPEYEVSKYASEKELIKNLHQKPDVITLDYNLPNTNGADVLKQIKQFNEDVEVIVISGQEDIATAVDLLKQGAYDYLVKDEETTKRLWNTILKIREKKELKREVETLKKEVSKKYAFENIMIGDSPAMKKVFELIEKASKTNINVSICGETGTGKELVAKSIHYNSAQKGKPFVAINMAAIPNELIESELFGHEKGAFTGAQTRRIGKFEEANGGSIFLDEISELELNLQSKILRVLQEREITRIGGNDKIKLDLRIITATHKNIAEEVRKGNFREDLYYRIIGFPIELPPLRERKNDVILIANFIISEFCKSNNLAILQLTIDAKNKLNNYYFPGNIRELKAIIELACVLSNGKEITVEDIQFNAPKSNEPFFSEEMTLKEYSNKIILEYLKKYDENVLLVAEKLDIGKSTIYNLLKEIKN